MIGHTFLDPRCPRCVLLLAADAKAIETRSAGTPKSGSARQGESAVPKGFAQSSSGDPA